MRIKRLSLLPAGRCQVDVSIIDSRVSPGQLKTSLPIWVYLIETTDGPILIDTGMPEACVKEPFALFEGIEHDGSIVPKMKEEDAVLNILNRHGYKPDDLACLISSHLHFDHAGGNELFPNTEIVVQRAEYEAAQHQPGYFDICKRQELKYKIINGDHEIYPGINLLSTPGHSVGHQSVLVSTKDSGNILLTIDAAYTRKNYEENIPFAVFNRDDANTSITKLKEIEKSEKATVFFGHDTYQEREWSSRLTIY